MFIAAFFELEKNWNHLKCSSVEQWICELWYIHIREYCVAANDAQASVLYTNVHET